MKIKQDCRDITSGHPLVGRDPFFDSLKFFLIMCVVLGHVMEHNVTLNSLDTESTLYIFIYTFHMPLFIFVSGYFSKNIIWAKFKKNVLSLLLTYYVFQAILSIPLMLDGSFLIRDFLFHPRNVMWYIPALLFWRFAFCFIPKLKIHFFVIIILSIVAALTIGFKTTTDSLMYLPSRIIVFSPYFILGYYCSHSTIEKIRNWNKIYSVISLAIVFVSIYLFTNVQFAISLHGIVSFDILFPNDKLSGCLYRLLTFSVSIFVSLCIINIMTTKLAKWGNKTMDIYLLHAPLVYILYINILATYNLKVNLLAEVIVFILIVIICLFLSNQKIIQYLLNPIDIFKQDKPIIKL